MGQNGAGKSTLAHVIAGVHQMDGGEIYLDEVKVYVKSPFHARRLGISIIKQEPELLPEMTITENIFLGNEVSYLGVFPKGKKMQRESKALLESIGCRLHPNTLVRYLSTTERYIVAIMQAIARKPKLLIMDEPSEKLTDHEREQLFKLIEDLKKQGIAILYITHRLQEIPRICDRITILRDGKHVITRKPEGLSEQDTIKLMIGHDISRMFPPINENLGSELLRVENLSVKPWFEAISFQLREGEILGLAGLVGAGRTALAATIFGQIQKHIGTIYYKNQPVNIMHPHQAVSNSWAYVNEDRLESGLMKDMSVSNNISISNMAKNSRYNFLQKNQEQVLVLDQIIDLGIKVMHIDQEVKYLSGGNQQKVVLARWLAADSEIYLLDEPTRGIDIGSKAELYIRIQELARQGKGIILISTDIQEIIGLCTRTLVMHRGKITGDLSQRETTEESITSLMTGEQ
ncbi:ribose import ATP-binding protein RbsA [Paenibacillus abyssi]|uniref:Ribose import ATP-binding protein RbsA n=1 Tax=Paenibacillus abyssi TaxID=1340531 RepID=A0A917CYL3_9BACL|nr:ribose import ATP-binding protein RbsA [Paenibacillus abyssi]